jgi:hypothetical protein
MATKISFPNRVIETLEKLRAFESPDSTLDEYLSDFYGQSVHVVKQE